MNDEDAQNYVTEEGDLTDDQMVGYERSVVHGLGADVLMIIVSDLSDGDPQMSGAKDCAEAEVTEVSVMDAVETDLSGCL